MEGESNQPSSSSSSSSSSTIGSSSSSSKPALLSFALTPKKRMMKKKNPAVAAVFATLEEEAEEEEAEDHGDVQHDEPPHSIEQKLLSMASSTQTQQAKADALREAGNARALAGHFREGLHLFEEALKLQPRSGRLYELKAQAHLQLEEWMESVKAAQRAVELDPTWNDAALTLGRALMSLGEVRPAVKVLSALYAKDSGNAEVCEELISANEVLSELRRREDDFSLQLTGRAGLSKQEEEVARAKFNLLGRGANVSSDCFLGGSEGSLAAMTEERDEDNEAEDGEGSHMVPSGWPP